MREAAAAFFDLKWRTIFARERVKMILKKLSKMTMRHLITL
jgi:hypothetical protein